MNYFDYILIAIVGLSMVLSLWRGFVREIISLIGLVAAFLIASRTSGVAGDFLGQWIPNSTTSDIAGFIMIFIVIMIVVGLVGALIRKLVDMADLTATDRTLGMFFGIARGVLLIALSFLIYTSYTKPDQAWAKKSLLTPYAIQASDLLGQAIPEGYPFSRQGKAAIAAPKHQNTTVKTILKDIPIGDKEALKSIIQQQLQ
ncbi:MAG: colicin V production protein [Proteobacteria bacterium]|nr:MAG: colicin V production protein [Pseudomonadota bacterium]